MKGIILAGGSGTRLRPLTKVTNKHLLPIYKWPMVYYPLHTLIDAGVKEILVISGADTMPPLMDLLGDGSDFGVDITYRIQSHPGGIPHAIAVAEPFIGKDKFISVHGDNIVLDSVKPFAQEFEKGKEECRLMLVETTEEAAKKSGVAAFDSKGNITGFVEKSPNPPSKWVSIGVYMFTPKVFDIIRSLTPGPKGELESVDMHTQFLKRGTLEVSKLKDGWVDAGTFDDLVLTNKFMQEHFDDSVFAKYANKHINGQ
jgi:glucose-1-phosphate thymidylyltransferase